MIIRFTSVQWCFSSEVTGLLRGSILLHRRFLAAQSSSRSLFVGRSVCLLDGPFVYLHKKGYLPIYLPTYRSCNSDSSDFSDSIDSSDNSNIRYSSNSSDKWKIFAQKKIYSHKNLFQLNTFVIKERILWQNFCDKNKKKIEFGQNSKTESLTNSKNQIVSKLKKLKTWNCDTTQKKNLWQFKNSNLDITQKLKLWQNS